MWITSTVDPSKRYTQEKSSMGSENRQIFRCNLKSVAMHSIPPERKPVALSNSSIYCG